MMDMMNTTGTAAGYTALWGIHTFSVVLFTVGIILLILWAARTLNQAQLQMWGITLAVVGTIVCLLTISITGAPWSMGGNQMHRENRQMMERMMDGMMDEDDAGHMGMDDDAMGMSMNDMAAMLEGKTGDAFDAAFIEGMIPHHQGAIDMARAALQSAQHEEIKTMAREIITAQQREIEQMRQWQQTWGYAQ